MATTKKVVKVSSGSAKTSKTSKSSASGVWALLWKCKSLLWNWGSSLLEDVKEISTKSSNLLKKWKDTLACAKKKNKTTEDKKNLLKSWKELLVEWKELYTKGKNLLSQLNKSKGGKKTTKSTKTAKVAKTTKKAK
jgi:ElaB/YqjD/DUF883 family membrane-anchored ribosome-binding protein